MVGSPLFHARHTGLRDVGRRLGPLLCGWSELDRRRRGEGGAGSPRLWGETPSLGMVIALAWILHVIGTLYALAVSMPAFYTLKPESSELSEELSETKV